MKKQVVQPNLYNMTKGKTREVIRYIENMDQPKWLDPHEDKESIKRWYKTREYALKLSSANAMLKVMKIEPSAMPLPYFE